MKKLATTLALATVFAAVPASVAHADSYVRRDATADVVSIQISEPTPEDPDRGSEEEVLVPAPERREGDIVSSAVRHSGRKVVLKMRYRSLSRTTDLAGHLFSIRTNEKVRRDIAIVAGPRMWRGQAEVTSRRGEVRCRGLRKHISYARDQIRVVVPRRCLSNPRWVQVGMGAMTFKGDFTSETMDFFADDARTNGALRDNLGWGARVRHN